MTRRRKDPLRALTDGERVSLEQLGRAPSAPAGPVARVRALLGVAGGCSYTGGAAWSTWVRPRSIARRGAATTVSQSS
jgi:hypothetical protein